MQNHIKTPNEGIFDPQLKKIIAGIALLLILLAAFLFWQKSQTPTDQAPTDQAHSPTQDEILAPSETEPAAPPRIDTSDWKTYTSQTSGITFKYPPVEEINDYRLANDPSTYIKCPLTVEEDTAKGEIRIGCNKQEGVGSTIRTIKYASAKNDSDIQKFIDRELTSYPSINDLPINCKIDQKLPANNQSGVWEIKLNTNKTSLGVVTDNLGDSTCPLTIMFKILYSTEQQKVLWTNFGQDDWLCTGPDNTECYDGDIFQTIAFVK